MKPIIYYFALLPVVAACSSDDVLSSFDDTESNEIRVDVVTSSASRATELHSSTKNSHMPFYLWSYGEANQYGRTAYRDYFLNQEVDWDAVEGKWYFKNGTFYWPHSNFNSLNFYAFHGLPDGATVNRSNSTVTLKNVIISDSFKQDDLLFASAVKASGGVVSLEFKHLLSQICVQFSNKTTSMALEVQKIELFNVDDSHLKNSGSYSIDWNTGNATLTLDDATSDDATLNMVNQDDGLSPIAVCPPTLTSGSTSITQLSDKYTALVFPQTVASSAAVLKIYFKVYNVIDPKAFIAMTNTVTDPADRHKLLIGEYTPPTTTDSSDSSTSGTGSTCAKYGNLIYPIVNAAQEGGWGVFTIPIDDSAFTMQPGYKYIINLTFGNSSVSSWGFSQIIIKAKLSETFAEDENSPVTPDSDSYLKESTSENN